MSAGRISYPHDWNDPDFVWLVHKRTDTGEILGPSMAMSGPFIPTRVTHAKLLDNGQWAEVQQPS